MRRMLVTALVTVVALAGSRASVQAQYASNLTINGYSSFEFEKQVGKEGNGDPNGSFDADLFDIVLNFQVNDAIRASADLTWEHGAASEDGLGNVAVEYAFVEYAFTDLCKVRVGKMFTPFGIYNEIHTAKPAFLTVKEPASTNKTERIVDDAFRYFPRWGTGIAVRGDGLIKDHNFSYDVFLSNGDQSETNPFEKDNNTSKAVTARFRFEPTSDLEIGNSFYYDKRTADGVNQLKSYGLELRYQVKSWRILAESAFGWLEPTEGAKVLQVGWYVQPSYEFRNGMSPYMRIERIDPDRNEANDQGYDLIVGLNYEISAGFMIKIENNHFTGASESSLAQFPGRSYNEIKAAVALGF
jgi:Putative beta-barrel porin-2, OmpL-like. bbp2